MKISELIAKLAELKEEHGDIQVLVEQESGLSYTQDATVEGFGLELIVRIA